LPCAGSDQVNVGFLRAFSSKFLGGFPLGLTRAESWTWGQTGLSTLPDSGGWRAADVEREGVVSVIWTPTGAYLRAEYDNEADLEAAILRVQNALFGPGRIYLDVKRRIGAKGGLHNVPDGYLLDLTGRKPRLYVVENELAAHDPLRHIAVQILQFSLSFQEEPRGVKAILYDALNRLSDARARCEEYARNHDFRNLDHMLEYLVFEAPFAALVIIDDIPEDLQTVLTRSFQFGVEVLELARYTGGAGESHYRFEPFLADLNADLDAGATSEAVGSPQVDTTEVDTVVVPARQEGFQAVFLGENCWHAVRIHGTVRPQIKHIAAYQVAPISAITHVAPVKSIEPWKDTGKVVVNFSEPARPIGPIVLVKGGRVKAPQSLRYTTRARLEAAKTLDDLW